MTVLTDVEDDGWRRVPDLEELADGNHWDDLERLCVLPTKGGKKRHTATEEEGSIMKPVRALRCAIYTRVSTDQGLEQEFNSLDGQREASEAYIKSQAHEGWRCVP